MHDMIRCNNSSCFAKFLMKNFGEVHVASSVLIVTPGQVGSTQLKLRPLGACCNREANSYLDITKLEPSFEEIPMEQGLHSDCRQI